MTGDTRDSWRKIAMALIIRVKTCKRLLTTVVRNLP